MPFTPADATKYDKAASTPAKQRMWASIANAVLQKHGDDGMAIRVANSKVESLLIRAPLILEVDEPKTTGPLSRSPARRPGVGQRFKQAVKRVGKEFGYWMDPDYHDQQTRERIAREGDARKPKLVRTPLQKRTG